MTSTGAARSARGLTAAALLCVCAAWPQSAAAAEPATEFGVSAGAFAANACQEATEPSELTPDPLVLACPPPGVFDQAAGHPGALVISFAMNATGTEHTEPVGTLENLRLDLPAGMSLDPQAVPRCSLAQFNGERCPAGSQVGESFVTTAIVPGHGHVAPSPAYNLEPPAGMPAEIGIAPVGGVVPIFLQGGFSWHREAVAGALSGGDYHEYATVSRAAEGHVGLAGTDLLEQLLVFSGEALREGFLTMPSACSPSLVYRLTAESTEGQVSTTSTESAGGVQGCRGETPFVEPPFAPAVDVEPETSVSDSPDGVTLGVRVEGAAAVDQAQPTEPSAADPRQITFTLPNGMTLNPAAATGLTACTREQFGVSAGAQGGFEEHPLVVSEAPVACPAASRVGGFTVRSPQLPEEVCRVGGQTREECPAESERESAPLRGGVYIAQPLSDSPQSGEEFRLFLAAESQRLGVQIRLLGEVRANATTGRLETSIETPQLPFTTATVQFEGGSRALLANPLTCPGSVTEASLLGYGEQAGEEMFPAPVTATVPFAVSGCPFVAAFDPDQSAVASPSPPAAGAGSAFSLLLTRPEGQQYLAGLNATLPEGLLGDIAAVPVRCSSAQAAQAQCPPESQLGTVTASAGVGPEPLALAGALYLTGPFDGAPFGLAIEIDAHRVGPYDFGEITARARVELDPHSGRVVISTPAPGSAGAIPEIVDGVPLRLRSLAVTLSRAGFIRDPTSCSALETDTTLSGAESVTGPATASSMEATPFRVAGCSALAFKPTVGAVTSAAASVKGGAGVTVSIASNAQQAGLRELDVGLPKQLVPRLGVLQHACRVAQVSADFADCPARSVVGHATLRTPLLAAALSGPAILISRSTHALDALAFVLEGEGVRLVLESHAVIEHGQALWAFSGLPDAPLSSFTVAFPAGPHSLLISHTDLCSRRVRTGKHTHTVPLKLGAPSAAVAQNGRRISDLVTITVTGCPKRGKADNRGRGARSAARLAGAKSPSSGPAAGLAARFIPDHAGSSTTVAIDLRIAGAHGTAPPPLSELDLHAPAGLNLLSSQLGLATCTRTRLARLGLSGCPADARLGYGQTQIKVATEAGVLSAQASLTAVFGGTEGEALSVLLDIGVSSPAYGRVVIPARLLADRGPFGTQLSTPIPAIPVGPEGPDVAITRLRMTLGPLGLTYYRQVHGHKVPFTPSGPPLPRPCPRGGYPFAVDLTFMDGTRTHARAEAPCPSG